MAIHIGQIIQKTVNDQRLTYRQFGNLIHLNEKTVPDIYERRSVSTDLLVRICTALKTDLLCVFYEEEPLKSLRNDTISALQQDIKLLQHDIKVQIEINKWLERERSLQNRLIGAQDENIRLLKENMMFIKERLMNTQGLLV
jgi:hypothetical protein